VGGLRPKLVAYVTAHNLGSIGIQFGSELWVRIRKKLRQLTPGDAQFDLGGVPSYGPLKGTLGTCEPVWSVG
jgi:hypothetical protein